MDIIKVAQHVVYFDAGKADIQCVDGELGHVEVVDRVAVDQFAAIGIIIAYLVDFIAGVFGQVRHLAENLLAVEREIFA